MSESKTWHAWVIKRNRLDNVVKFIREQVLEVDKYFSPLIEKEYQTKRGTRVKDRPLYEGYIFLRYNDHNIVFHKLSVYPFVTTYAGPVSDEEIERMQASQGKLLTEIKTSKFSDGDPVALLDGPFKGFEGVVLETQGDDVKVRIDAQILGKGVEMAFNEDVLERKTQLQNTEVQDIG